MLTYGQACCLILDKEPTKENREDAKRVFEDSIFGVTRLHGMNPMDPIVMTKDKMRKNPYKYKPYPPTPPTSPSLSPVTDVNNDIEETFEADEKSVTSISTRSSQETTINYSKASIIQLAKTIFTTADPENTDLYKHGFFTNQQIYDVLQKHLPRIADHHSLHQIAIWLDGERVHFGPNKRFRVNKILQRGRLLWACSEETTGILSENDGSFRQYCKNTKGGWVNVGYVRKSRTNDPEESRVRLLQLMMTKLVARCLCTKLFASPASSSTEQLLVRDVPKPLAILSKLRNCNGDTQDLFAYLSTCTKKVRLCILDYAGLSNDPKDVQTLLKLHKNIKEVAIDHGSSIELLDRFTLLHGEKKIEKFKCRVGPIRRSKV